MINTHDTTEQEQAEECELVSQIEALKRHYGVTTEQLQHCSRVHNGYQVQSMDPVHKDDTTYLVKYDHAHNMVRCTQFVGRTCPANGVCWHMKAALCANAIHVLIREYTRAEQAQIEQTEEYRQEQETYHREMQAVCKYGPHAYEHEGVRRDKEGRILR